MPFSCTHLPLWRGKEEGLQVHLRGKEIVKCIFQILIQRYVRGYQKSCLWEKEAKNEKKKNHETIYLHKNFALMFYFCAL